MKVSAIPAQITTVEDRIAGNLNLTQLLLLATPLFLTAVIFFVLPPIGHYALYKLVFATILTSICSTLAIRIKDSLILDHIRLRANYELRPHVYVYRSQQISIADRQGSTSKPKQAPVKLASRKTVELSDMDRTRSHRLLTSPKYRVVFQHKTGGLIVRVSYLQ